MSPLPLSPPYLPPNKNGEEESKKTFFTFFPPFCHGKFVAIKSTHPPPLAIIIRGTEKKKENGIFRLFAKRPFFTYPRQKALRAECIKQNLFHQAWVGYEAKRSGGGGRGNPAFAHCHSSPVAKAGHRVPKTVLSNFKILRQRCLVFFFRVTPWKNPRWQKKEKAVQALLCCFVVSVLPPYHQCN